MDALDDVLVCVDEMECWGEVHWGVEYIKGEGFVFHWDWKGWGGASVTLTASFPCSISPMVRHVGLINRLKYDVLT